jgi:2-oxoglutarate ferredoxin oxidoreductase subunit delta
MALLALSIKRHNQDESYLFHLLIQGVQMPAKGWIEVSDTYCKGCELCLSACPQEVMELDMSRLTPKGYHPAHTFKDGCTGCAICALVCPDAAITVYRETKKVAAAAA